MLVHACKELCIWKWVELDVHVRMLHYMNNDSVQILRVEGAKVRRTGVVEKKACA